MLGRTTVRSPSCPLRYPTLTCSRAASSSIKTLHCDLHPKRQLPAGRLSDAGFENVLDYCALCSLSLNRTHTDLKLPDMSFNGPIFHKIHVNMKQPLLEVTRVRQSSPQASSLTHSRSSLAS